MVCRLTNFRAGPRNRILRVSQERNPGFLGRTTWNRRTYPFDVPLKQPFWGKQLVSSRADTPPKEKGATNLKGGSTLTCVQKKEASLQGSNQVEPVASFQAQRNKIHTRWTDSCAKAVQSCKQYRAIRVFCPLDARLSLLLDTSGVDRCHHTETEANLSVNFEGPSGHQIRLRDSPAPTIERGGQRPTCRCAPGPTRPGNEFQAPWLPLVPSEPRST